MCRTYDVLVAYISNFCDHKIILKYFNAMIFPRNNKGNICERMTNGCSVPTVFLKLGNTRDYSRLFEKSCNRHDICYFCSMKFGFERSDCDNQLYQDMARVCRNAYQLPSSIAQCLQTANKWGRLAVGIFGFLFYVPVAPYWCNSSCVKDFMPNKNP